MDKLRTPPEKAAASGRRLRPSPQKKDPRRVLFLWRWANYSGDFLGFKIILQPIEYNRVNEGR